VQRRSESLFLKKTSIVLLILWLVTSCGVLRDGVSYVSASHPVWLSDGWVYYLREVDSQGAEVWRLRDGQDGGERVLTASDIPSDCRGVIDFLFRAPGQELGVATECDGTTITTILTAYSPKTRQLTPMASAARLIDATFHPDNPLGYVRLATECATIIVPIHNGAIEQTATPVTITADSKPSSTTRQSCGALANTRSPAMAADGRLFFIGAPDATGKPAGTDPNEFMWNLYAWDAATATSKKLSQLGGIAELAVSPDGKFIVAAIDAGDTRGTWIINANTGKKKQITTRQAAYQPSLSPVDNRFVYVEGLRELRFETLPAVPQ
jgi:hypothetical protein